MGFSPEPMHRDTPFFVFGCPRSGTSLLSRMLHWHPRLAVPYESHVLTQFTDLVPSYRRLGRREGIERLVGDILSTHDFRYWDPVPDRRAITAEVEELDIVEILSSIVGVWARQIGKERWGEKTPGHLFHWDRIQGRYPDAKIVHIVRDPRDVALSWIKVRFGVKTFYMAASRWRLYLEEVSRVKELVGPRRLHEVKYEDLLENPESELRTICEFLGESYSDRMLSFHENRAAYGTDAVNESNLKKPLLTRNSGKWATELSPAAVELVESVTGDWLLRYGYEQTAALREIGKLEDWFRRNVESPPARLWGMARNRRGYAEAWGMAKIRSRLILSGLFR